MLQQIYESDVERRQIRQDDEIGYKFTSPGVTGVPDRIKLRKIKNKAHKEIVARYIRFVEYKKPKGKLSPRQMRVIEKFRDFGYAVFVVDGTKK